MDNKQQSVPTPGEVIIDYRSFLTWIATAFVMYSLLSGLMVTLLPFWVYTQFSIIIHTIVGLVVVIPLVAAVYLHWQRRRSDAPVPVARSAIFAMAMLGVCLLTGLVITAMALFGIYPWVPERDSGLEPEQVLTFKARIEDPKPIAKGESITYFGKYDAGIATARARPQCVGLFTDHRSAGGYNSAIDLS